MIETFATFKSRCAICDKMIEEDDPIVLLEEDQEWVHKDCGDEA